MLDRLIVFMAMLIVSAHHLLKGLGLEEQSILPDGYLWVWLLSAVCGVGLGVRYLIWGLDD